MSQHGFWILIGDREWFVSFEFFPWFRDLTIAELAAVELPSKHHLYWPLLDIDLAVESLDYPDRYSLVSPMASRKRLGQTSHRSAKT